MYELSWDNPYEITPVTLVPVGDRYAEIDAEDWERVRWYKWYLLKKPSGDLYAYAPIYPNGKQKFVFMHRLILGLNDSSVQADHRNYDGLDNRKSNLRKASHTQNLQNARVRRTGKYSQYKGVCRARNKWEARICVDKQKMRLGLYNTEEEAALAYNEAAVKYFGEFAYLNKI